MKNSFIKIFTLHLGILITYLAITCYSFVIQKDHNPIGAGLQQWVLVILHFIITLIISFISISRAAQKKEAIQKAGCALFAIVLGWCLYLWLSDPLWNYLWTLRRP